MDSFDVVNTELVIVAVTLALLFFLVRRAVGGGGHAIGPPAREAFDRRNANGEMTREEYLTIKNDISREDDA